MGNGRNRIFFFLATITKSWVKECNLCRNAKEREINVVVASELCKLEQLNAALGLRGLRRQVLIAASCQLALKQQQQQQLFHQSETARGFANKICQSLKANRKRRDWSGTTEREKERERDVKQRSSLSYDQPMRLFSSRNKKVRTLLKVAQLSLNMFV